MLVYNVNNILPITVQQQAINFSAAFIKFKAVDNTDKNTLRIRNLTMYRHATA